MLKSSTVKLYDGTDVCIQDISIGDTLLGGSIVTKVVPLMTDLFVLNDTLFIEPIARVKCYLPDYPQITYNADRSEYTIKYIDIFQRLKTKTIPINRANLALAIKRQGRKSAFINVIRLKSLVDSGILVYLDCYDGRRQIIYEVDDLPNIHNAYRLVLSPPTLEDPQRIPYYVTSKGACIA